MLIFVWFVALRAICLVVKESDTIAQVKALLLRKEGISQGQQRLLFR